MLTAHGFGTRGCRRSVRHSGRTPFGAKWLSPLPQGGRKPRSPAPMPSPHKQRPRRVRPGSRVSAELDKIVRQRDPRGAKSRIGCEVTTRTKMVQVPQIGAFIPETPDFAVRGTSVRGRVPSAPLRKANRLAGPYPAAQSSPMSRGHQNRVSGHVGDLPECQEGEPVRTDGLCLNLAVASQPGRGYPRGCPKGSRPCIS
jgi:hypothetical protein